MIQKINIIFCPVNYGKNKMKQEEKECIFCKIVRGEIKSDIVYSDDNFIAFLDINPKAEGHTVIVSKKHFRNLLDMPTTLGNEMLEVVKNVSLDLIKQGKAEGFNLVVNNEPVAGQIVFHAHIHILPRKKDDGLKMLV
jgi:histidine triad (HIT) family protein